MKSDHTLAVKVFRCNPSTGEKARFETYEVPFIEGLSVSNILIYINENYDGGLAHYLSCRRGLCAGCMVRVDGKPVLACTKIVHGDIVIEPVKRERVIKDLVIRLSPSEDPT